MKDFPRGQGNEQASEEIKNSTVESNTKITKGEFLFGNKSKRKRAAKRSLSKGLQGKVKQSTKRSKSKHSRENDNLEKSAHLSFGSLKVGTLLLGLSFTSLH